MTAQREGVKLKEEIGGWNEKNKEKEEEEDQKVLIMYGRLDDKVD